MHDTVQMPQSSPDPRVSYIGGLVWPGGRASWPFVRLTIDDAGLRIGASFSIFRLLGQLVTLGSFPNWDIPWSSIDRLERSWGAGVRIVVGGVTLCSVSAGADDTILNRAESHGVQVDRSPGQFRWYGP